MEAEGADILDFLEILEILEDSRGFQRILEDSRVF